VNVTLSVYKPAGLTAYGRRRQHEPPRVPAVDSAPAPGWIKALAFVVIGLIVLFVLLHLTGRGLGSPHH